MSVEGTGHDHIPRVVLCGNSLCARGLESSLRASGEAETLEIDLSCDTLAQATTMTLPADVVIACASVCAGTEDGPTLFSQLQLRYPGARVIAISPKVHASDLVDALESGAMGFVACGIDDLSDLKIALVRVLADEIAFSSDVSHILIEAVRDARTTHGAKPEAAHGWGVTDREQHVLALLCDGMTNQQIATALQVSPNTVKNHLASIYEKLKVNSRGEAISIAMRLGII